MKIPDGLQKYARVYCDACKRSGEYDLPCERHCTACGADAIGDALELDPLTITQWDPNIGADLFLGLYCPQCGKAIKALLEIGA